MSSELSLPPNENIVTFTLEVKKIKDCLISLYFPGGLSALFKFTNSICETLVDMPILNQAEIPVKIRLKLFDLELLFTCEMKYFVLFHIVVQNFETLNVPVIDSRPHVVAVGLITRSTIHSNYENSELFYLGLNSNLIQYKPFDHAGYYLKRGTGINLGNPQIVNSVFKSPVRAYYLRSFDTQKELPMVPNYTILGLQLDQPMFIEQHPAVRHIFPTTVFRGSAIDIGAPINYIARFDPKAPACTGEYLLIRLVQLSMVYNVLYSDLIELLKNYPFNEKTDNQFCEAILIKLGSSETITRPYSRDFQIYKRTTGPVDSDYHVQYDFVIGDCVFDGLMIYRIWMTILFSDSIFENAEDIEALKVIRASLAKVGVPVVFKGEAGDSFGGHMFAGLVQIDYFAKLVDNENVSIEWERHFRFDTRSFPARNELVLIGEGTSPATVHYEASRSSDHKIKLFEHNKDSPWAYFTIPIHFGDSDFIRFHKTVSFMFTWAIPVLFNLEIPSSTTFGLLPADESLLAVSCVDLQYGRVPASEVVNIDKTVDADYYRQIKDLYDNYFYTTMKPKTGRDIDFHRYPESFVKSKLSDFLEEAKTVTLAKFNKDYKIGRLIYIYDLDDENFGILKRFLQKHGDYTLHKLGYSWVITIFEKKV